LKAGGLTMYGIITGDIVASGEIEATYRQQLFKEVDTFLSTLKRCYIKSYETFRGDSLQCEVTSPESSLRVALLIRAFFRAYIPSTATEETEKSGKGYFTTDYDIRLAIGIGEVDFMNDSKITSSDGQAFRFSGEGLDSLKDGSQRLILKTVKADFDEQMEPSILLVDALIQKWTQNQAQLALYKLQQIKEDEIAAKLGISKSAVTQRKKTAQWHAVDKLIYYFEKTVKTWNK
jgi:hypothetical protein